MTSKEENCTNEPNEIEKNDNSFGSDSEPSIDNLEKDELEKFLPIEPNKKINVKKRKNFVDTKTTKIEIKEEVKLESKNRYLVKELSLKPKIFSSTLTNKSNIKKLVPIPTEVNLNYKNLKRRENNVLEMTRSFEIKQKYLIYDVMKKDQDTQTEEIFFQMYCYYILIKELVLFQRKV